MANPLAGAFVPGVVARVGARRDRSAVLRGARDAVERSMGRQPSENQRWWWRGAADRGSCLRRSVQERWGALWWLIAAIGRSEATWVVLQTGRLRGGAEGYAQPPFEHLVLQVRVHEGRGAEPSPACAFGSSGRSALGAWHPAFEAGASAATQGCQCELRLCLRGVHGQLCAGGCTCDGGLLEPGGQFAAHPGGNSRQTPRLGRRMRPRHRVPATRGRRHRSYLPTFSSTT